MLKSPASLRKEEILPVVDANVKSNRRGSSRSVMCFLNHLAADNPEVRDSDCRDKIRTYQPNEVEIVVPITLGKVQVVGVERRHLLFWLRHGWSHGLQGAIGHLLSKS